MKQVLKRFILVLCFIIITMIHGLADTLRVDPDHFLSIKSALSQAKPADHILVSPGLYQEGNIIISRPVHLIGVNFPVLDGNDKHEIITIESDSVSIEGFIIRNAGSSFTKDLAGIKVLDKDHGRITSNKLYNTYFGIYLKKSKYYEISGNELVTRASDEVNSGNGIHLWDCEGISIRDNSISGHRDGIYFEFVENSEVINNNSEKNLRYGLHFMFSNQDRYEGNTFRNNGTGVAVMFSKNIIMKNNYFLENWGSSSYGLLFKEIYDGELTGNTFMKNTIGLYSDGSNRIKISENDFIRNGWALNILGNSMDNTVSENNFIGNTFDIATNTKNSQNHYNHNFWDQYTGYDLNKDGYGDIPFRPVKVFSYVIGRVPASIILLRSSFIDMLNFAEKVVPVLTPGNLEDKKPVMKRYRYD